MGKMKEIHSEIVERLFDGESPEKIAKSLNIPLEWVTGVEDDMYVNRGLEEAWASMSADADAAYYGSH